MQFLLLCFCFLFLFIIRRCCRCLLLDSFETGLDWLGTFALEAQKLLIIFGIITYEVLLY